MEFTCEGRRDEVREVVQAALENYGVDSYTTDSLKKAFSPDQIETARFAIETVIHNREEMKSSFEAFIHFAATKWPRVKIHLVEPGDEQLN